MPTGTLTAQSRNTKNRRKTATAATSSKNSTTAAKTAKKKATTKVSPSSSSIKTTKSTGTGNSSNSGLATNFSGTEYQLIDIESLMPTSNLFDVSSSVPYVSQADFEKKSEHIEGQQRAAQLLTANLKLATSLQKAEGQQIKFGIAAQKNTTLGIQFQQEQVETQIAGIGLERKGLQLQHAQIDNQIFGQQIAQSQLDLDGETKMTAFRSQVWELRLESAATGIEQARNKLAQERHQLAAATIGS